MKKKITYCLQCNQPMTGRRDKKFCSAYCRSDYHNKKNKADILTFKSVDTLLHKNRNILLKLLTAGLHSTTEEYLNDVSFDFRYHTHQKPGTNGIMFNFCYDIGYHRTDNGQVWLRLES